MFFNRIDIYKLFFNEFSYSRKFFSSNPRNTKKKIIKPIVYNAKNRKSMNVVSIASPMELNELAELLNRKVEQIQEAISFTRFGSFSKNLTVLDDVNLIKEVVEKCGFRWKYKVANENSKKLEESLSLIKSIKADPTKMEFKPPVVTIMGHVDHGKTTLLDALRKSNIVSREFGGITQHIGAFMVRLGSDKVITFIDTPGHAAFSSMRARGAKVTDIIVLVVAADDGVMKQTVESIRLAKEVQVPVIVAINKVDKFDSDINRTKNDLLKHGIHLEEFGGDIQAIPISALKGTNLDLLKESILVQSEMMELRADPTGTVEAVCIESKVEHGRGRLATVLVQKGTLKRGNILVAGSAWAKVRGIFNDEGIPIDEVKPGYVAEIIGWRELISSGESIYQVESEKLAKQLVLLEEKRNMENKIEQDDIAVRQKSLEHKLEYEEMRKVRLEKGKRSGSIYRRTNVKEEELISNPQFYIVVKGDVDGTVEAILDVLMSYNSKLCQLHILQYGVGMVNEKDVEMARAFNGIIYAFNVNTPTTVFSLAKESDVPIHNFNVIYKLIDDIKLELNSRVKTIEVEEKIGEANVLANFTVTEEKKKVFVAGCRCVNGSLGKKHSFRLIRNGEYILEGKLHSLKHFKNEVESIKTDVECGVSFTNQEVEPMPGDQIICFKMVEKKQEIDWNLDFL